MALPAIFVLIGLAAFTGKSEAGASQGFAASAPAADAEAGACDPATRAGRVAVIDLDRIASSIGRDKIIASRVQEFAREQEKNLNKLRDELMAQLAEAKEKLGESPGDQERLQLARLAERSQVQLRQEIAKVEKVADQLQIKLVLDFKQEVTPFARRVATSRCLGIVMIQQNDLMFVHPVSDITEEVIDRVQEYTAATSRSDAPAGDGAGQ